MVATPKRAAIKKSNKHIKKKNNEKDITVTPLIPTTKTNQFHSLHSPSGLLKYGFASSKKGSIIDFKKSMKAFGRIYTGHAHVLSAEALQELEPIFLMSTSGLKLCHMSSHGIKVLINGR